MLLQELTHEKQEEFYRCWCDYRSEKEYLALDITSISSYSQNIDTVEWGYNRDHEKLPQVNLCMIVGETSRLPVFQMLYNGSIKDVSTLKTTLREAFSIGRKKLALVMDKGFYSKENVDFMLKGGSKESFLIALPHTTKLARGLITETKWMTDNPGRAIKINDKESIQGMTKQIDWNSGQKLLAHVYYNLLKAADAKFRLYSYVASLGEEAKKNPCNKQYEQEFKHYLNIEQNKSDGKSIITIKNDVVNKEVFQSGWMILISNNIRDVKRALSMYRSKDAVEKGFYRLKDNLDLHRLRIHSNGTMTGKIFIGFIALIIMSHIHHGMTNRGMYKSWTLREVIKELEKLRVQYIGGNRILYPLTKSQKEIFFTFGVDLPS